MAQPTTKPHTFPILRDEEIISMLANFDVKLSVEELQKPITEVVREVFEQIVQRVLNISTADLRQPRFEALAMLTLPELHQESIGELQFWRNLLKLMNTVGVEDFGTRDIHRPEYKRFRKHLSGLINFVMFRDDRIVRYEELTQATDQLNDEKQNLESELEARQKEVRALKAQFEKDLPIIQSLQSELETTEGEIKQLNKRQVDLQYETRDMKTHLNSLAESKDEGRYNLLQAKAESNALQKMVVSSPQKVKKNLEDMGNFLELEKESIITSRARISGLQANYELFCKVDKDLQKCISIMDECDQEMRKYKLTSKELKETKSAIQEKDGKLRDITNKTQHSTKGLHALQEKTSKQAKQFEVTKSYLEQQLIEVKNERQIAEKEYSSAMGKLKSKSQDQMVTQQRLELLRKEHEKEINALGRKYETLALTVQQYHKKLFSSMNPKK